MSIPRQFLRRETLKHLRLGRIRRKVRKWRRPRGKSNKMRLGRAGYPVCVKLGYRTAKKDSGKVEGLIPRLVNNIKELESLGKNEAAILARVGARKKLEIIKKADELKIKILNLNSKKGDKN